MKKGSSAGSFNEAAREKVDPKQINPKGEGLTKSGGEKTEHGEGGLVIFPM